MKRLYIILLALKTRIMNKSVFISILLFLFAVNCIIAENNYEIPDYIKKALDQTFYGFQENKGQITNNKGEPVPEVLFKATTKSGDIYITKTGISFVFIKYHHKKKHGHGHGYKTDAVSGATALNTEQENNKIEYCRVDMVLKNAKIATKGNNIVTEKMLNQGHENYFLPHCPEGIYGIKTYKKITIKSVYEKIDWVLYADPEKGLKHEFILHPGADPDKIRLEFKGEKELKVTGNGRQLNIQAPFGEIQEGDLFCYEKCPGAKGNATIQSIDAQYKVKGSEVSYVLKKYDKENTVVIDPAYELVWSTFYGGMIQQKGFGIATDTNGNIFVTGYTNSFNFPDYDPGGGVYWDDDDDDIDIVILKFNNDCKRLWATYYVGDWQDEGRSIAVCPSSGNVYVTAITRNGDDLSVYDPGGGAYMDTTLDGTTDIFIMKFDNDGVRLWATFYGGSDDEGSYSLYSNSSVTVDPSGNVYITGITESNDFPCYNPGGGCYYDSTLDGDNDLYIVKFDSSCQRKWATYYGGSGKEVGRGIAAYQSGVYVIGQTEGTSEASNDFPVKNPGGSGYYDSTFNAGTTDMFILKFSDSGERQWATYYGGSGDDDAYGIATDQSGNVYITGYTASSNFPLEDPGGSAYYDNSFNGLKDMVILNFNSSCQRQWATLFGGNGLPW